MGNDDVVITRARFNALSASSRRVILESAGRPYGLVWGHVRNKLMRQGQTYDANMIAVELADIVRGEIHR